MSRRIDYAQIAAKLDYPALDKKLEQLNQCEPPRAHKTAADVLEPLRERLLELQRKGWSSGQLAEELKAAGVPVSPARLRECLSRWANSGSQTVRRSTRRRAKPAPHVAPSASSAPTPATARKPVSGTAPSPFTLH